MSSRRLLRGRIGLPPVAQAALAFAYVQLGCGRGLRPRKSLRGIAGGHAVVHLDGPAGDAAS